MHSTVHREYWQTEKPVSRPTTSRPEIVCIACVAIAAVVGGSAGNFKLSWISAATILKWPNVNGQRVIPVGT